MPLSAAAVCPHPPLLVPELAAGAAGEMDALRAACDAAVARLLATRPRLLVILGSATDSREYRYPFGTCFEGFGVPFPAPDGGGTPAGPPLPLSLSMGMWLLYRAGWTDPVTLRAESVAIDAPVAECVELGRRYAHQQASLGLLVMGDGTACRGERAPGAADPRAHEYDALVTKALAEVETGALLGLDERLGAELRVAGRAPWQVLAAAAAASPGGADAFRGEVSYDAAPYGVNYTVALWTHSAA
ncbi:MAG: hypothetical protein J2P15_03060 [Micromonosporaceae bacterium]|nr:hypothetical protein [Micromonosporaceae bacterium]